jgi:hypothetical protein
MLSKIQVQIVVGVAVVVWAVLLFVEGVPLKATYLKPYSVVVTVVVIGLILFDRWLWRIPGVSRLVRRPVLQGTWKGTLQSSWKDPVTHQGIEPIAAFFAIRQTYSTISLRLMTKESTSRSMLGALDAGSDGVPRVSSTYENVPGVLIQDRSRIHHGALLLDVHGSPAARLTGWYWTDRDTKGEVSLDARQPKVYTSFDEASVGNWQ